MPSNSKTSGLERSVFGLTVLKNSHPDIRKLRKEAGYPEIHGNKFWKSSLLLMDYLNEFPPKKGARVLEVGCGWGLAGIYCAKVFSADVIALDADDTVFPYAEHHAKINQAEITTWQCRYEQVKESDLRQFDLVIGADICFWDSMSRALFKLVKRAYQAKSVRVVLTDPGRPPFREMAEKVERQFEAEFEDWHTPHPHNASGIVLDMWPDPDYQ